MRARRLNWSLVTLLMCADVVACSSTATPPVATVAAAPAPKSDEGAEAEPALTLTPVPAPDNIVAIATLRAPAHVLDTAMGWTGLGLDWRTFVSAGALADYLPVLDLDVPVDALVTLDPKRKDKPKAFVAVSVGLRSRQSAIELFRGQELAIEAVEPGIDGVTISPKCTCFIAAALGRAKTRLVCAENRESLDLLSPYLTRGEPSNGTGNADLHVDIRAELPWKLYGDKAQFLKLAIPMLLGEMSIGNPDFDAVLREALSDIADELILGLSDLKDLLLEARFDTQGNELDLQLGSNFHASTSWLAHSLADAEARQGTPGDGFWKLPGDATQAFNYATSNPATSAPALDVVERLLKSGLSYLGASPALSKQWPLALKQALAVPGPLVSARGRVPAQLLANPVDAREELRSALGYTIIGVEDASGRYGALLEQTLHLYEDASLRKGLNQKYGVETGKVPKVQSKKGPAKLPQSRLYEFAVPAELYAQLIDKEVPESQKLSGTIPVVVLTFREGNRTWLGASSYARLLEDRFSALLAPSAPEATLTGRAGLERLRAEPANVAGFWTLAGLQNGSSLGHGAFERILSALPPSQVPIIATAKGKAEGPSGQLEIHVPAQVFRDAASVVGGKP